MANPQCENGYTKIANEIMDNIILSELSGQAVRLMLFIIRKTYGFHKKSDRISLSQMSKAINAHRIRCSQITKGLVLMNILTVNENINGIGKSYSLQKDYEKWQTVNENINCYKKTNDTVNENIKGGGLMKTLTTKDTILNNNKDTLTKDNTIIPIVSNVFQDVREHYARLKQHDITKYTKDDYARTGRVIKLLLDRANNNNQQIMDCITWVSKQGYNDWTLETCNKKWHDFINCKGKSKGIKTQEEILKNIREVANVK